MVKMKDQLKKHIGSRITVYCGGENFNGQVISCDDNILKLKLGNSMMHIVIEKIVSFIERVE